MDTATLAYWPADTSAALADLTAGDALREAAAKAPQTTALVEGAADPAGRRRWSYAELLEASERAARALLGRFAPGDRVAVWASNIPEWVILELAAALAAITVVTVNPALRPKELAYVLSQSRADGIFLVPAYRASRMAEMVEQVRGDLPALREVISFADWEPFCAEAAPDRALPEVSPHAPAQIQYTSGTTGSPKGAVLHHRGIVNNARLYTARLGLAPGSVQLSAMPLFHTARVRDVRPRRGRHPRDADPAAALRSRPDARAHRRRAPGQHDRRADHAHRHARPPRVPPGPARDRHGSGHRRGRGAARAGRPGGGRVRRADVDRVRPGRGVPGDPAKLARALLTIAGQDKPLQRFIAGGDAIEAAEAKARELLAQAEASGELGGNLSHA